MHHSKEPAMSLNINRKLLLLATVSVLGFGLLSGFAIFQMRTVFTAAIFANDNTVPALEALRDIEGGFDDLNIHLWQRLAQSASARDNAELDRALRDDLAQMEKGFKAYEPTVIDDEDKALLAADRAALNDFQEIARKAVSLIDAGRRDEASFLVLQNQGPVEAANNAIDAHEAYNIRLAQQWDDKSDRTTASARVWLVGASVLVGAIVLAMALLIRRAIIKPLMHAGEVLGQIGQGKLENTVTITNRDEIGTLLAGLDQMQTTLRERGEREREAAERERATAVENGRIRTALDRVSAGAMLADVDGNIIYMNDSVRAILRTRAGEIRKSLPAFDAERVQGSSVDAFGASAAQRTTLSAVTGTQQLDLAMGEASLRLVANPVTDAGGGRIGTVVEWTDRTVEVSVEREVQTIVARAVEGDLTGRIGEQGKEGFFKSLAGDMNSLIDNMTQIVRTMGTASGELISGAEEISKGNTNLSQRTEEQASSLEETASSMEQITATVKNAADHAAQADQLASAAREQAENGGAVVASAVTAMGQINESSKKIADIIGVIDEIAFQTNLLALNAAVEAARAGEQGRGFAVVASEVRSLAGRSATAAKEIKTLINDSVARVEEGSSLVEQSGKTLGEIVLAVKKVTDIVSEIASGTQEQSSGIEQVNKAVMQMDETTQQNAALVEQAAAASQAIVDQAHSLNALVARYRIEGGSAAPAATAAGVRRTAQRPWSGPKPAAAAKPARAPLKKVANGPAVADSEWESF
jgi:methyl-accepting chemotaxis protein